jgi:hypothetical protein
VLMKRTYLLLVAFVRAYSYAHETKVQFCLPARGTRMIKLLHVPFSELMSSWHRTGLLLLVVSTMLILRTPRVYSQGSTCYFTAMNLYGPPTLPEGGQIEVRTLFSVTCPGGGFYVIRGDLVDGRTAQILSTTRIVYATIGPFSAVLTNDAMAPKITGWWSLQMNLYMLDTYGAPVAPQSQQIFGLIVTS